MRARSLSPVVGLPPERPSFAWKTGRVGRRLKPPHQKQDYDHDQDDADDANAAVAVAIAIAAEPATEAAKQEDDEDDDEYESDRHDLVSRFST